MHRSALGAALIVAACQHNGASRIEAPNASPTPQCLQGAPDAGLPDLCPAALIARFGSGVEPYKTQDGVWLPHAPVLVNEEFDFATAMSLGPVGAGLAAAQRKQHNEARAKELEATRLPAEIDAHVASLRACGVHRWGILWNGREPALLIVDDVYDASGRLVRTDVRSFALDAITRVETWR